MLIKTYFTCLVTFFVAFTAQADQKGLSFISQPGAPQSQIEWFVDSEQGSQWSFNLRGTAEQLIGKTTQGMLTNYKARVYNRATGEALIGWQGTDELRFYNDNNVYFLLTTADAALIPQLQNPSDNIEIEISYKALSKGTSKSFNHRISLREFCDNMQDRVVQPFTGETGCFKQVTDNANVGRCTAAERDTFCNSAFNEKRPSIEKKLGCQLTCK